MAKMARDALAKLKESRSLGLATFFPLLLILFFERIQSCDKNDRSTDIRSVGLFASLPLWTMYAQITAEFPEE